MGRRRLSSRVIIQIPDSDSEERMENKGRFTSKCRQRQPLGTELADET